MHKWKMLFMNRYSSLKWTAQETSNRVSIYEFNINNQITRNIEQEKKKKEKEKKNHSQTQKSEEEKTNE